MVGSGNSGTESGGLKVLEVVVEQVQVVSVESHEVTEVEVVEVGNEMVWPVITFVV
jgi:hypothetical protein